MVNYNSREEIEDRHKHNLHGKNSAADDRSVSNFGIDLPLPHGGKHQGDSSEYSSDSDEEILFPGDEDDKDSDMEEDFIA